MTKKNIDQKYFHLKIFFGKTIFFYKKLFLTKKNGQTDFLFNKQIFLTKTVLTNFFLTKNLFFTKCYFWSKNLSWPIFFLWFCSKNLTQPNSALGVSQTILSSEILIKIHNQKKESSQFQFNQVTTSFNWAWHSSVPACFIFYFCFFYSYFFYYIFFSIFFCVQME